MRWGSSDAFQHGGCMKREKLARSGEDWQETIDLVA